MSDWTDGPVRVLIGNVRARLADLPDTSVHCVVTSPPYWGLRDYGVPGQLGLEETPDEYIAAMGEVFREARRVLRTDGTLWLNLGDSYAHGGNGARDAERWPKRSRNDNGHRMAHAKKAGDLKPKDLVMLPAEVALALRRDGWWLRSDVIWAKPNPMPESVSDRPTTAHEHVFLLAKAEQYFYDAEAVREPHSRDWSGNGGSLSGTGAFEAAHTGFDNRPERNNRSERPFPTPNPAGRNLRSVWTIATQPYPEAHFATFPEELARRCIAAGTSERGCCVECGAPWRRIVEVGYENPGNRTTNGPRSMARRHETPGFPMRLERRSTAVGWESGCAHDGESVPCTVLDPFAGSGTTLAVARRMGRAAIGIELQSDYLPLIRRRVSEAALPLLEHIGLPSRALGGER